MDLLRLSFESIKKTLVIYKILKKDEKLINKKKLKKNKIILSK